MGNKPTKDEQETVITFTEAGKTATVYTYNARWKRRLTEIAEAAPGVCRPGKADGLGGETFEIDKRLLPLPKKPRKRLTDDQRAAAAARLRKAAAQ